MITPEPKPATPGKEICVPEQALATNGDTPEVGAEVEFTSKGRVTRIEGGHVYIETTQVNGEPVVEEKMPKEMDEDDMMRMAEEADESAG